MHLTYFLKGKLHLPFLVSNRLLLVRHGECPSAYQFACLCQLLIFPERSLAMLLQETLFHRLQLSEYFCSFGSETSLSILWNMSILQFAVVSLMEGDPF